MGNASYNSYDSVAGVSSEAAMTIEWRLFDNNSDSVVFTQTAQGKAKGPVDSPNTILGAIKGSFREVLANPAFLDHLRTSD